MRAKFSHKLGFLFLIFAILVTSLNVNVTPARAAGEPVLTAPAEGLVTTVANYPPLGIPEFRWNAVSGATMYRIQVSTNVGFTDIIVNVTTPNLIYTPINAAEFADTVFYWRVRVEGPAVGNYSLARSFTKSWASGNAPNLIAPANAATLDFYDAPAFSWSPVTGAAKYEIQIYTNPGGWATLAYSEVTLTTTHQPKSKLLNGSYYWRVVPLDPFNRNGTPSAERSFTAGYNFVPTLLEPTHNATPTFTPTFRWTAVRGAQYYNLEYSTDPSFAQDVTRVDTRNTSYTPINTLSNDVNYYWRVQAISGSSVSAWSAAWTFRKQWYIKPVLLTPTNGYQHVRFPFFSWTPVPGASRYFVEIDHESNFSPPLIDSGYTDNTFFSPEKYNNSINTFYWRVTPYDGNDRKGKESETFSYRGTPNSLAPHLAYPLFYYPPDAYPAPDDAVTTNPHEDRTVPYPIFAWHRVLLPAGDPNQGEDYAEAYRIQVSTSSIFLNTNWTVDTENTYAAPSADHPFDPLPNTDYYWRVCALVSGSCPTDVGITAWSQVWRTRFDPSLGLAATSAGAAPVLLRPTNGFELVESTPLLEWKPVTGATSYEVEISRNEDFSSLAISPADTVSNPAYAPTEALARRRLNNVNFGVYFWRVRQKTPTEGAWSTPRRFQIAAQSQWQFARTPGDASNRLYIGSDPSGELGDNDYDIDALYAAQDINYWYFGFDVPIAPAKNVAYALYIDTDHVNNSGATSDPHGYSITTISAFRPEYVLYILQEGGPGYFAVDRVFVYKWNGSSWDNPSTFDQVGGSLNFDNVNGRVELKIPNTIIGYQDTTGSYAVSLISLEYCLSIPCTGLQPKDSVPADPNAPGGTEISRFSNVSERVNLVMPPTTAGGADPSKIPSILPFLWDWPIRVPYAGAFSKAYTDPGFTTQIATYTLTSNLPYWARTSHAWGEDFSGDNTYYWRVQPRYTLNHYNGAWSQGWSFKREGFKVQNLQTSVTFSTPTFSWDRAEGAEAYQLQVSTDVNFGTTEINVTTRETSYTDDVMLPQGTYFWRVRVHRNNSVTNTWSATKTFTLTLPKPSGLAPANGTAVSRAPTLSWNPLIVSNGGNPVLAAWKYRVQVSKNASFSPIFDTVDTEQSSWTPIDGYDDGTYYWRVAMLDGSSKLSNYTATQTFTKQYPVATLISPVNGAHQDGTPTFIWSPVIGAARYKLEVSLLSNFTTLEDSVTSNNTRYTPTEKYPDGQTYYWRVAMYDASGNLGPYNGATVIIDPEGPTVLSSRRVHPNPTARADVQFTVTFSENVTGVGKPDFLLTKTGAITGHSITTVSGSGKTYTVTVDTGTGDGTLRLDVKNDGTIKNSGGIPLEAAFASGETYTVTKTFTAKSVAAQDGYILETGQNTTAGGTKNATATTVRLGDDAAKKQYRSILSFNTAPLPDTAVITKITLKLKKQSVTGGGNPISAFQGFMVDIKKGFFGSASSLASNDFQAAAPKTLGPFTPALVGSWYSIDLTAAKTYVNKATTANGLTQIRLRFKLGDNGNGLANYLSLFSGNAGAASAPQLIIVYYVP